MSRILYEEDDFPILQNRVYETFEEAVQCPRGDIRIIEDEQTGLIFNSAFRSDLMSYDSYYNNEQSVSSSFRDHLVGVTRIIDAALGRDELVEVGCGKGFFLEMLLADGFDVTGFDPTYEGDNPRVVKQYFSRDVLQPSRGLILRHVLEHIPDPFDFLCQLRDANGGRGLIYIEVPCFDWICEKRAWFDIFYEHVNYFRARDFYKMFGNVLSCEHTFGGQYLSMVADLATLTQPQYEENQLIDFPNDFLSGLNSVEHNETEHAFVWGGASKGVIFSLLRQRIGRPVTAVIDVNPAKQGKYLPVTGLKVLSPTDALSQLPDKATVYVMNSNYVDEIREMSMYRFNYVGVDH
jgi:hypothetical protein